MHHVIRIINYYVRWTYQHNLINNILYNYLLLLSSYQQIHPIRI